MGHQSRWQLLAIKIFRNERVVGRLQAVLHGQVKAGGCFATSADPHQNNLGRLKIAVGLTVVMGQREVDGFNPVVVFLAFADIGEAPHAVV